MIIKREDVENDQWYFPIAYGEMVNVARRSGKRFFTFNCEVFDIMRIPNTGAISTIDRSKAICEIEDTDGDGYDYVLDTVVISGFPGIGKSQFVKDHQDLIVLDSDSSNFSWEKDDDGNNTNNRNPNFPSNYINHIKENLGKVDIILVSSHDIVRKALKDNNIKYYLIYPSKTIMDEYMDRYIKRGSDYKFLKVVENNWDAWINDIEEEKFPLRIKLWGNQYLNDLFKETPICTAYRELCSVKDTAADEYPTICHECNSTSGFAKLYLLDRIKPNKK